MLCKNKGMNNLDKEKIFSFLILFIVLYSYKTKASTTKVPVLLYHHILSDEENTCFRRNGAVISTEQFEKEMKYLHDNGFTTITLLELQDFLYKGKSLPDKSILITFDDGYYSNVTRAYPILKKYDFNAVIFLIATTIKDKQTPFNPDKLIFMAEDSIKSTKDVFEYASHTYDLHRFSDVDNKKTKLMMATKDEIIKDLKNSFNFVDNRHAFAYPLGQYNDIVLEAMADTYVYMGFTVKPGYVTRNSLGLELNRFIIFPDANIQKFKKIVNGNYKGS